MLYFNCLLAVMWCHVAAGVLQCVIVVFTGHILLAFRANFFTVVCFSQTHIITNMYSTNMIPS